MNLAYIGSTVLRKKTARVDIITPFVTETCLLLKQEVVQRRGLGLAAPQINRSLAIFAACFPEKEEESSSVALKPPRIFINPKIISISDETWEEEEGCLSIPQFFASVERPNSITIEYQDEELLFHREEFFGWNARIVMHENDHLNGVLFIDRLSSKDKKTNKSAIDEIKEKYKNT